MTRRECVAMQRRMQQGENVYVKHPEHGCCLVRRIDPCQKRRGWIGFIYGRSGSGQCYADEVEPMEPTGEETRTIAP